jgi:hypothetical protein
VKDKAIREAETEKTKLLDRLREPALAVAAE